MESKICKVCNKEKKITEFDFRKDTQNHRPFCIVCRKERDKAYTLTNRVKEKGLIFKSKLKIKNKKYCKNCDTIKDRDCFSNSSGKTDGKSSKCKDCVKFKSKENELKIKEQRKNYYLNNSEKIKKERKLYCLKNSVEIKQYLLDNKDKYKKYRKERTLNLLDIEIKSRLKRSKLTDKQIKENPELIEIKRLTILLKRELEKQKTI